MYIYNALTVKKKKIKNQIWIQNLILHKPPWKFYFDNKIIHKYLFLKNHLHGCTEESLDILKKVRVKILYENPHLLIKDDLGYTHLNINQKKNQSCNLNHRSLCMYPVLM